MAAILTLFSVFFCLLDVSSSTIHLLYFTWYLILYTSIMMQYFGEIGWI